MACSPVDDGRVGDVFAVVYRPVSAVRFASSSNGGIEKRDKVSTLTYKDRPNINEDEERDIRKLLQRENVWEDVIRYTLRKAIQWMECMARIRRGHDPLMMRFVQSLVNQRVVQPPMDPINEEIGE